MGSNCVPSFAEGLHILVVDHDTVSLESTASMLIQYSYKVTTTEKASAALSMILEEDDRFKLVMADCNMLDMDALSFIRLLLKTEIPVIIMSYGRDLNMASKALSEGACFFLEKPIHMEDLKFVWQHVYRTNKNRSKENHQRMMIHQRKKNKSTESDKSMAVESLKQGGSKGKKSTDDITGVLIKEMGKKVGSGCIVLGSKRIIEEKETKDNNNNTAKQKSRIVWNSKLHHKFLEALSRLGKRKACPTTVLRLMNEPSVTPRQVASHLQKYRNQVQKINKNGATELPSPSSASNSHYQFKQHGNILNCNLRMPYLSSVHGSVSCIPSLHQTNNANELQQETYRANSSFLYDVNLNENAKDQQHLQYLGGDCVQTSHNVSDDFCFPDASQEIDFSPDLDSHFSSQNPIQQISGNSSYVENVVEMLTDDCLNQNQPLIEYTDVLKILEEDPGEYNCFGGEFNLNEVDEYCEWIRKTVLGNEGVAKSSIVADDADEDLNLMVDSWLNS